MAKVPQNKDKDFDVIMPKIDFTDMSDEHQALTHEICREAYSKYYFPTLTHNCCNLQNCSMTAN